MPLFYFLIYLLIAIVIGVIGRKLSLGFVGFFLISFFLTPAVGLVLLVALAVTSQRPQ